MADSDDYSDDFVTTLHSSWRHSNLKSISESHVFSNDENQPVVLPVSGAEHRQTLIMLHGRGDHARSFSLAFSTAKTSSGRTLQQSFPGLKLIFPQAPHRPVRFRDEAAPSATMTQWFEIASLRDPALHEERQIEGLRETLRLVADLVDKEASSVGAENVVVRGLSMGAAAALTATLVLQGSKPGMRRIGGYVGMSGWYPLLSVIKPVLEGRSDVWLLRTALARRLSEKLDIPEFAPVEDSETSSSFDIWALPCFVGHGSKDATVDVNLGRQVKAALDRLSFDIVGKDYADWGHLWKEPDEIDDLVNFLQQTVGWPMGKQ